jgi:Tfp pilus assembly protein PilP
MQKLIVLLLILIMIAGCKKNEETSPDIREESQTVASAERQQEVESLESIKQKLKNRNLPRSAYGREDPFAAIGSTPTQGTKETGIKQKPGFQLEGIIWDAKEPVAVINGKMVKEGDKVGDKTVERIDKKSVKLFDGKTRIELRL